MATNEDDAEELGDPLVVEVGSGFVKCGYAGQESPFRTFPSLVGRPKFQGVMVGMAMKDAYIGDEAMSKRGILNLKIPMVYGQVSSWDDTEKVWHHTFYNELRRAPEEHPVVLVDNPLTKNINREKTAQIMFESFYVPYLYIGLSSVFALYAEGKLDGLSVDFGLQSMRCLPVYEGHALQHAFTDTQIGGGWVTDRLMKLLEPKYAFTTMAERLIAVDIKEKLAVVSIGNDNAAEIEYEMPDGTTLTVGKERYECTEDLFRAEKGVQEIVKESVMKCDEALRDLLCANIVTSGGCAMLENMEQRLQKEIQAKFKDAQNINVVERSKRSKQYLSWIGASIFASMPDFTDSCVERDVYDEYGPKTIHHRCF